MAKKYRTGWRKKLLMLLCISLVSYASGTSLTTLYASHLIAGVDYPYDEANYYNPSSVSWADSAPSPFALRDLVAQGGSVYDYTRHIKSILYGTKFDDWLNDIRQENELDEENMKHSDAAVREEIVRRNANLADKISSSVSKGMINLPDAMTSDAMNDLDNHKANQQAEYLNQTYLDSVTAVQRNVENTMDVYEALQLALERNSSAQTAMQIKEVQQEIAALDVWAKNILSNIYGEKNTLNAAARTLERLERMEQKNAVVNDTNHVFLNPYDENDRHIIESMEEHANGKMYQSKGMPDF